MTAPADDLAARARRGVAWSAASFGVTKLLGLATTVALARLLAPADLGLLAAVLAYAALVELAGDLGLKSAVVYEQERGVSERVQTAFTTNVLLAVLLGGAGAAVAPLVAGAFGMSEHTGLFRLASLALPLGALGNVADGLLVRELRFRARIVPEVVRTTVRGATQVGLALAGLGATGLVAGLLAGTAAWSAAQWAVTGFRPTLRLDRRALQAMAGYGSAAAALEVLAVVSTRADALVVGGMLGAHALGLYAVASRLPELAVETVAWNLSAVAFPAMARTRVHERDRLAATTATFLRYQVLCALPVAAVLVALAQPLAVTLFGAAWRPAGGVLAAIAVTAALGAAAFPLGDALKAMGRQRALVALNVAQLPLMVVAMVLAAPAGIVAVAWVRAAARLAFVAVAAPLGARAAGIRSRDLVGACIPGLAAAAGAGGAAACVRLAWGADDVAGLLLALATAAGGAGVALRLVAPSTLRELRPAQRRSASGPITLVHATAGTRDA